MCVNPEITTSQTERSFANPTKGKQRSNAWLLKKEDIKYMAASLLMAPLCSVIWLFKDLSQDKKIFKEKINWDHFSIALSPHMKPIFS